MRPSVVPLAPYRGKKLLLKIAWQSEDSATVEAFSEDDPKSPAFSALVFPDPGAEFPALSILLARDVSPLSTRPG